MTSKLPLAAAFKSDSNTVVCAWPHRLNHLCVHAPFPHRALVSASVSPQLTAAEVSRNRHWRASLEREEDPAMRQTIETAHEEEAAFGRKYQSST